MIGSFIIPYYPSIKSSSNTSREEDGSERGVDLFSVPVCLVNGIVGGQSSLGKICCFSLQKYCLFVFLSVFVFVSILLQEISDITSRVERVSKSGLHIAKRSDDLHTISQCSTILLLQTFGLKTQ